MSKSIVLPDAKEPRHDDGHGLDATAPAEVPAKGWKDVALRVKDDLRNDHTSLSAAGVAFFGFLAFIPALAAVISVYGLIAEPADVQSRMQDLFTALPTDARELLTDQITRLTERSGSSLGIGLVISVAIALWSASSGMAHLLEAINIAYGEQDERGPVAQRGMALIMTIGVLVVVGVAATGFAAASTLGDSNEALRWIVRLATWAVAAALFVGVLAVLYRHGPDRDEPRWRWVSPGAMAALVGWLLITVGFGIYVSNFGSYDETYGSLASIVILLFWLYLSAFVVILGAELNSELEHQTARDSTQGAEQPLGTRDAEVADTVGVRS
ncbi:MAG: YihY/virulence factor BrkB family protein [Actinomycetota bacterium]|nr:YihY/virulence factor BrkB family protein [Actinomycetota bacterium]